MHYKVLPKTQYLLFRALLAGTLIVVWGGLLSAPSAAANATVTVNAGVTQGTFSTELNTQIIYPSILEEVPGGQARLNQYAPPKVRIILGTDGAYLTADHLHVPTLPAGWNLNERPGSCVANYGYQVGNHCWDFTSLNLMVNDIYTAGARPAIDIGYMPDWLWNCAVTGTPTPIANGWSLFGDYAARLVSYYNTGSFTAEDGHVVTNPAGTSRRVDTWELLNEPNFQTLACLGPTGSGGGLPALSTSQYLAMWNAVAPKMKSADPSIKLAGPATTDGVTGFSPDYLELVMQSGNPKPDIASFHGYGSYDENDKDRCMFDGYASGSGCAADGIAGLTSGLTQVQAWAPGRPTWVTELNVLASYGNDPKHRNWNALGAAWKASAFIRLSKLGASGLFHYSFIHPNGDQFSVININTGAPLLPFWVEYYLARDFPPGSTILSATSSATGVDTLAVRLASGQVDVLVANRQVANASDVGGVGVPATVVVNASGLGTVTALTLRQFDNGTPLATGPGTSLAPASSASISFSGYGAAILEFSTSGGSPTPTPTPTSTPTPTPTAGPSPSPTVTSVTPSTGPTLGGTFVTVRGTNFRSGVTVSFGGSLLSGLTIAGTTITGTTSTHAAGTVNVVVSNTDATTATCASCFTYSTATPSPSPSASPSGSGSPTPSPSASPSPTATPPLGAPTETVYLPNVTKTLGGPDGWDTPFIVQNAGSVPTTLRLSFYRFSDGALIAQRLVGNLLPGGSYADVPAQDSALASDTQYSVVVESFGAPIVSVVNETSGSGAQFQALSYTGATGGATTVFLPNITRRFYGYDTPFIVQNVGSAPVVAIANFTSFDGSTRFTKVLSISPGRSVAVDPDFTDGLADGTQYSVVLNADGPVAAVVNAHQKNDPRVSYSTNGISAGSSTLYGPYVVKSGPAGANSPIVVQNTGSSNVDATLELTPMSGGAAQRFVLSGIPAGQSRVFDPRFALGTVEPCMSRSSVCLGVGEYAVKMTANGSIAALVIPTGPTTADAYAATGFGGSRFYLPNVTRALGGANGWTTPIVLQSTGALGATLHWYRFSDGALAATQHVALPTGGSLWIDPRTVGGLQNEGQYAVVVEGDAGAAVNAIVYEQWLGGGDGLMIYSGFAR